MAEINIFGSVCNFYKAKYHLMKVCLLFFDKYFLSLITELVKTKKERIPFGLVYYRDIVIE